MSLGENIKQARNAKNMTQAQLAEALRVSPQAVSKWETSETYPDGSILVPLANLLGVSLDTLFDNKMETCAALPDVAERIGALIKATPYPDRMDLARELCWQIERGLFRFGCSGKYTPGDLEKYRGLSSFICNDHGFTAMSNGKAPFFALFPDDGRGWREVIGDGEEMRKIFSCLSDPDTMRAVLYLYGKTEDFVFDASFLARECGIDDEKIDAVLDDLTGLHQIADHYTIDIDGAPRTLFSFSPSHLIIALLIIAHELNHKDGFCFTTFTRSIPFLNSGDAGAES